MRRAPALALAALLTSSCGAALMKLPQGPGTTAGDTRQVLSEALSACTAVSSISAEAAVSGSIGGRRVRLRLIVGLAATDTPVASTIRASRIEALAFGQRLFVFVSQGQDATLLLDQEQRVLEHGAPDAVLEAVTGVPVGPDALRSLLTGCMPPAFDRDGDADALGEDWRVFRGYYFHRDGRDKPWRLTAVRHTDQSGREWRAEYRNFVRGLPNDIRLRSLDSKRFDLHLTLSQVGLNETFDDRAFRIQVPPSASPMTLQELRESGPLAGTQDR